MMKTLLKPLYFTLALVCLTSITFAQNPTVTIDNVPAGIELTKHIFASSDELVFTIDNIPDNNTTITANLRVYVAGSLANGSKKLQTSFNIDATSSATGAEYTFVESAGTNANTIKRVFTFTSLTPNTGGGGAGGNYILDEEYDILVRLVGGTPSPDDTNSNTIVPAVTMTGIADSVSTDVTITVDQTPGSISETGDLDQSLIFTIGNIPETNSVTINTRSYDIGTAIDGGSHLGSYSNSGDFNLTPGSDVDNTTITTVSTPVVDGFFNRTYTIKKHATMTNSPGGTHVQLAIRFVGGSAFTFDSGLGSGGGHASNKSFQLVASVFIDNTLSNRDFNNIAKSIYPNPVTSKLTISKSVKSKTYQVINLLGKTVKDVRANGSLDVSDLSSGIYILKTDAGIAKFVKK